MQLIFASPLWVRRGPSVSSQSALQSLHTAVCFLVGSHIWFQNIQLIISSQTHTASSPSPASLSWTVCVNERVTAVNRRKLEIRNESSCWVELVKQWWDCGGWTSDLLQRRVVHFTVNCIRMVHFENRMKRLDLWRTVSSSTVSTEAHCL